MKPSRTFFSSILSCVFVTSFHISYAENGCMFSRSSAICYEAKGKFLKDLDPNIKVMYILYSDMTTLEEYDFSPFREVTSIYISTCEMNNQYSKIWKLGVIDQIKSLFLGHSNLGKQLKDVIANNTKLETLYVPGNKIQRIESDLFGQSFGLEIINLEYNDISEIEEEAFAKFTSLRELHLSGNKIGVYFDPSFIQLPSGCAFCPSQESIKYPDESSSICDMNTAIDYLWNTFRSTNILYLEEQSLCRYVTVEPDVSTYTKTTDALEIDSGIQYVNGCSEQRKRLQFIQEACVRVSSNKIKTSTHSRNTNFTQNDQSIEESDIDFLNSTQSSEDESEGEREPKCIVETKGYNEDLSGFNGKVYVFSRTKNTSKTVIFVLVCVGVLVALIIICFIFMSTGVTLKMQRFGVKSRFNFFKQTKASLLNENEFSIIDIAIDDPKSQFESTTNLLSNG